MPFATNKRSTDAEVAIQMPPRVVAVSGLPMKAGSSSPDRNLKRCFLAWLLFSILGGFALAMYSNVLNSFPEFVDEAGNSTINASNLRVSYL